MVVWQPGTAHAEARRALRLMTYNVNYANPDPGSALEAIARADVDIVLLQEITSEWRRLLAERLSKQYPHAVYRIHTRAAGGLAVLSKLPISAEELLPSPERGWFPAQRLVIEAGWGALQILHVHLRPAIDGGSWVRGFMTTPPLRRREIETYWKHVVKDVPTLVAGDFNEAPTTGSALDFLAQHGLSRVETKGPTTWRYQVTSQGQTSDLIKLDIDYVLVDQMLIARDGIVVDEGRSDHRPVIVTIEPRD
jgi:endonuclease/exonuclease/phosphatase (EEP) superfamily protein YafD